jgi:hypothetical protein
MIDEAENLILRLLREMREQMATKSDLADLRSEMMSLRADVASDLHALDAKIDFVNKDLGQRIAGLRRAVMEYHSSAIGHGVLFTELEERMSVTQQQNEDRLRRIEQHLDLPPKDKH